MSRLVIILALWLPVIAAAADIETISRGSRVDVEAHLVAGKWVLVDFYADWCGPCRQVTPKLQRLAAQNPDTVAVRKVDIVGWDSAVARQYKLKFIPNLRLYGPSGSLLVKGGPDKVFRRLDRELGGSRDASPDHGLNLLMALLAMTSVTAGVLLFLARRRPRPSLASTRRTPRITPQGSDSWFVNVGGHLEGPYGQAEIRSLVSGGHLSERALIKRGGDGGWLRALEVIEGR